MVENAFLQSNHLIINKIIQIQIILLILLINFELVLVIKLQN